MKPYNTNSAFRKLKQIQKIALIPDEKGNCNLTAALRAEELKGKLFGLYGSDIKTGEIQVNIMHESIESQN